MSHCRNQHHRLRFPITPFLEGSICPGAVLEKIHPRHSRTTPFYKNLSSAPGRDIEEAERSTDKLTDFDASDDVAVIAHNTTLVPNKAND